MSELVFWGSRFGFRVSAWGVRSLVRFKSRTFRVVGLIKNTVPWSVVDIQGMRALNIYNALNGPYF